MLYVSCDDASLWWLLQWWRPVKESLTQNDVQINERRNTIECHQSVFRMDASHCPFALPLSLRLLAKSIRAQRTNVCHFVKIFHHYVCNGNIYGSRAKCMAAKPLFIIKYIGGFEGKKWFWENPFFSRSLFQYPLHEHLFGLILFNSNLL